MISNNNLKISQEKQKGDNKKLIQIFNCIDNHNSWCLKAGAGSGKTYEMMNRLDPKNTLVIIPQYRLKLTWDGFECTSFQRIEKNFKFTLLEIHPMFTSDETIVLRESFWKEVMMSRNKKLGYNSN